MALYLYVLMMVLLLPSILVRKRAIQVKSLKKPDLVDELMKRGVMATGTVKELKERLNTLILQLKTRYASAQKRTDVFHLNKDVLCVRRHLVGE